MVLCIPELFKEEHDKAVIVKAAPFPGYVAFQPANPSYPARYKIVSVMRPFLFLSMDFRYSPLRLCFLNYM